jgi:putative ABC transport system permease protein
MQLTHTIKESIANLFVAKLRTALTLLGILIGTASVVALVSSGELATQHALAQFKTLGTDLLAVSMSPPTLNSSGDNYLNLSQAIALKKTSPDIIEVAPYTNYYAGISYNSRPLQGAVIGANENLAKVVKIHLIQGRFISSLDKSLFYCDIGSDLADNLKKVGVFEPVGKQISLGKNIYTIVGVVKPWTSSIFLNADINKAVIIPIQNSFLLDKQVAIQNIIFKLAANANLEQVQAQITAAVKKTLPAQQLFFISPKQLLESMQKQRQTLTLLLAFIGGISLVVGGIGVMNIMLVSVIERRREIGVRMAIGATGKDIGVMFIVEAIVLTVIGGLLGIAVGVLISFIAAEVSGWGFAFFFLPPLIGFFVSGLVGIISGFYPAYKAAQLDPINTLRSE